MEKGGTKRIERDPCVLASDEESTPVDVPMNFENNSSIHDTYYLLNVVVCIKDIQKGKFQVRETRAHDETVSKFREEFLNGNYGKGLATVTCAFIGMPKDLNEELVKYIQNASPFKEDGKVFSGPNLSNMVAGRNGFTKDISNYLLRYVDGMHRSVALASEDVIAKEPWPRVVLHIRKDAEPMTELECIMLGSRYNVEASNSLPMTAMDRIHSLVSVLGTIENLIEDGKDIPGMKGYGELKRSRMGVGRKKRKLDDFVNAMQSGENLDPGIFNRFCVINRMTLGVSSRQLRKYTRLAVRIYHHKKHLRMVLDILAENNIPLQHLDIADIWETRDSTEQLIVLDFVQTICQDKRYNDGANEPKEGSSSKLKTHTIQQVVKVMKFVWRSIVKFFSEHSVTGEFLAKCPIPVLDDGVSCTLIRSFIVTKLAMQPPKKLMEQAQREEAAQNFAVNFQSYVVATCTDPKIFAIRQKEIERKNEEQALKEAEEQKKRVEEEKRRQEEARIAAIQRAEREEREKKEALARAAKEEEERKAQEEADRKRQEEEDERRAEEERKKEEERKRRAERKKKAREEEERRREEERRKKEEEQRKREEEKQRRAAEKKKQEEARRRKRLEEERKAEEAAIKKREAISALLRMPEGSFPVNEPEDNEHFSVHTRSTVLREEGEHIYVSYSFPDIRKGGYTTVWESNSDDEHEDEVGTYKGELVELGTQTVRIVYLYPDRDDGIGLAHKDFRLQGELVEESTEWAYAREMEGTRPDYERYEQQNHQLVLRALGLRPPHRSILALPPPSLHKIRRALTGALAHIYRNEFCFTQAHRQSEILKYQLYGKFAEMRAKLDGAGYHVIAGLYESTSEAEKGDNPVWHSVDCFSHHVEFLKYVHGLFDHMQNLIPTTEQLAKKNLTKEQTRTWECIRNSHRSESGVISGNSRLVSSTTAVTRDFEFPYRGQESDNLVFGKAMLETSVMQIASWLHLEFSSYHQYTSLENRKQDMIELECLDTGGRFISLLGQDAKQQVGHLDEFFPSTAAVNPNNGSLLKPSYFVLVTGEEGAPLWVGENSHFYVSLSKEEQMKIAAIKPLKLIQIPPWSLFIGRSDVVHAGCGGKEADGKNCLRFHMYLHRADLCLADAINSYVAHFYTGHRNHRGNTAM